MTITTEGVYAGAYISSEGNGTISREVVTLKAGTYKAGQVLGIVTADDEYAGHDPDGSDGTEVAKAVLFDNITVASGTARVVITARDSEVIADRLIWKDGITANQIAAAIGELAAQHIIAR